MSHCFLWSWARWSWARFLMSSSRRCGSDGITRSLAMVCLSLWAVPGLAVPNLLAQSTRYFAWCLHE